VETRSPAGTGWERDLVGGYALSDALMHNLVVTDDGDGHRLMAGKMPSWNSRALNIPSPGADISYYLYSPDATRVAFVQKQPDGRLRPFYSDLRSGSALGVPIGEASTQRWPFPAFSPDSRFVAYVIAKEGPIDLQVVDVSAQVPRPPVKVNGEGRVGVWPAWQPHWP
jgi:hypothetical protein